MMISIIPQPATKEPINLVTATYLTPMRKPLVTPPWAGSERDMPRLRAEARKRIYGR